MKEQKKNTGSALVVESVYSAQNAQFRLVMNFFSEIWKLFYENHPPHAI